MSYSALYCLMGMMENSLDTYFFAVGVSDFDAYAAGLPFCNKVAPKPLKPKTLSNDSRQLKRRKINELFKSDFLYFMFWSSQGRKYSIYGGFFSITLNKLKSAVNYSKCMGHVVRFQITANGSSVSVSNTELQQMYRIFISPRTLRIVCLCSSRAKT